jgi:peptide chain release factor 2
VADEPIGLGELKEAAGDLTSRLAWVRDYLDPTALEARLEGLGEQLAAEGFWDDPKRAAQVSAEHARTDKKLQTFRTIESEIADLPATLELVEEDESLLPEAADSLERIKAEVDHLQEQALFTGEYDAGGALGTLSAGAGGTDAQDWAEMLLRMYQRWAERRGFRFELLEATPGEEAGLKSATFSLKGENAYGVLQAEKGVHRLVRLSPFDSANRRQTSFAQLEVSPEIDGDIDLEIEDKDLRIDTYRAQGAGGQHVNKTDSAVRITHIPSGIVVQCQNERSQLQNRESAMRVLKSRLLEREHEQREAELARERGELRDNAFGSQIRSYVLHPYSMVKDERTGLKEGNAQGVLDGSLDPFILEFLLWRAAGKGGQG